MALRPPVADGAPPNQYKFADGRMATTVLAISPVPISERVLPDRGFSLPLNLIAMIISHIDDLGDLARITRTSRLLYYMTLPQLYEKVTVRSYSEVRYNNGRPEGFGGGSPLAMALSGLSTSNAAALVKTFRIAGKWKEYGAEDYVQGRIPDSSMLLSIILRNALERMTKVQSIIWDIDTKPLRTVYQGLASRNFMTSLSIKFPTSRTPRPVTVIPPIPNLRRLKVTELDPLCYPDDLSVLILNAKKLEDLRMHWSPRMRREAEPSINLHAYFGRCLTAGYRITVKHLAMQNFYGQNNGMLVTAFDMSAQKSTHFLDTFGGSDGAAKNVFIDDTWKNLPDVSEWCLNWKVHRSNEMAAQHAKILQGFEGLEELYLVSGRTSLSNPITPSQMDAISPKSNTQPPTPSRTPIRLPDTEVETLGREYLNVLTINHGATLRCLLLSDQWSIHPPQMAELVRCCPNLEQLGLALGGDNHEIFGFLIPFLPKLQALRVLYNAWLVAGFETEGKSWDTLRSDIGRDMYKARIKAMRWLGIGDHVLKIGGPVQFETEDGKLEWRKDIVAATLEDVRHVDIWAQDVLEI